MSLYYKNIINIIIHYSLILTFKSAGHISFHLYTENTHEKKVFNTQPHWQIVCLNYWNHIRSIVITTSISNHHHYFLRYKVKTYVEPCYINIHLYPTYCITYKHTILIRIHQLIKTVGYFFLSACKKICLKEAGYVLKCCWLIINVRGHGKERNHHRADMCCRAHSQLAWRKNHHQQPGRLHRGYEILM